jgi:N-methylhydantoinase B
VLELADRYGVQLLSTVLRAMLDRAATATHHALSALSDGVGEAEGFLDDDGRGGPPTRIHARVTKHGDRLKVDLSGSAAQVAGAMNVPWASTRACIVYAVRCVVAPDLAANDGILRAVDVVCPQGNVLNPNSPAAVSVRHNTCQRLADTLIRAMIDLWPELGVASSTVSFFGLNIGSASPRLGRFSVLGDVVGGGTGATPEGDGIDGVDTYMSNVGLMPAEVVETNYQVRLLRCELRPGSQGRGAFSGGLGLIREYEILDHPQRVTYYAEQTNPDFVPRGLNGGQDAAPSRISVTSADGSQMPVAMKGSIILEPGSVLRVETAGGGGWGSPSDRSEDLKRADVEEGRLN